MQTPMSRPTRRERALGRAERPLDLAVLAAALLTIPLVVLQEQGVADLWVVVADWLIWLVFAGELAVRLWAAADRWATLRRHWLSLTVVVLSFPLLPGLLALVRLTRLTRLARVLRLATAVSKGMKAIRIMLPRQALLAVAGATGLLVLAAGGLLALLEPELLVGGYWDGIWWGVVTATTVGYGDIVPRTPLGRLMGIVLMLAGMGLISTLAAALTAYFVGQDEAANLHPIARRLDEINTRLERLERQLERPAPPATAEPAGESGDQESGGEPP